MHTTRTYLAQFLVLSIALTLALGANYLYAAWSGPPSGTPPTCPAGYAGCDAPVNVGANAQTKTGDLTVSGLSTNALSVFGNQVVTGKLGVGATSVPLNQIDLTGGSGSSEGIRFADNTVQKTAAKDLIIGSGISTFINDVGTIIYNLSGYTLVAKNFGTDWSLIILSGFLNRSDDSTAGGFIYRKSNGVQTARIFIGSDYKNFVITTWQSYDYNCVKSGGTDFVCVYLDTSGDLLFRIQDDRVTFHYVEFW